MTKHSRGRLVAAAEFYRSTIPEGPGPLVGSKPDYRLRNHLHGLDSDHHRCFTAAKAIPIGPFRHP